MYLMDILLTSLKIKFHISKGEVYTRMGSLYKSFKLARSKGQTRTKKLQ